jgi:hypothetical protein
VRFLTAISIASLALIAAGCGDKDKEASTPVSCLEGAPAYRLALETAPNDVRMADGSQISDCLAPNQSAGDLARVGEAMVEAATYLNVEMRSSGIEAPVQLGYLVGAAEYGAEESEGIHSDLVRRLTVAARYAPGTQPFPAATLAKYRDAYEAGRKEG